MVQWQPGISPDADRLNKKRGSGVSPALFGHFCAYKSDPGYGGGQAPLLITEGVGPGRPHCAPPAAPAKKIFPLDNVGSLLYS